MAKAQFPLFRSSSQVRAAEIRSVDPTSRRIYLTPIEGYPAAIMVDAGFISAHSPKSGDWVVEMPDGSRSVVPAAMFGDYEQIDEDEASDAWKAKADEAGDNPSDVNGKQTEDKSGVETDDPAHGNKDVNGRQDQSEIAPNAPVEVRGDGFKEPQPSTGATFEKGV